MKTHKANRETHIPLMLRCRHRTSSSRSIASPAGRNACWEAALCEAGWGPSVSPGWIHTGLQVHRRPVPAPVPFSLQVPPWLVWNSWRSWSNSADDEIKKHDWCLCLCASTDDMQILSAGTQSPTLLCPDLTLVSVQQESDLESW